MVSLPGQWNCESPSATVVYMNFGAWKSPGQRRKSIVVVVSPLEVLVLDVAKAFTAMDTSNANSVSQHHSSGLPCGLNCLPKVAVALSKVLSSGRFITSIFIGSKCLQ